MAVVKEKVSTTRVARAGQRFLYVIGKTQGSTRVERTANGMVEILLNPNEKTISAKEGDVIKHDLDKDNVYDLRIDVYNVGPFGAQLGWMIIKEEVPLSERPALPAPQPVPGPTAPVSPPQVTQPTAPEPSPEPEPEPFFPQLPSLPSGDVLLGILLMTAIVIIGLGSYFYVEYYMDD